MRTGAAAAIALAILLTPALASTILPMNRPVHLKHLTAVCTGIGADQEGDPRWRSYPLKVVMAGKLGQYLAGADLHIAQHRTGFGDLRCGAPVVLLKLPPGRYRLTAGRLGATSATYAWVANKGQGRAVLRFPHQGGTVSAAYLKSLHDEAAAHPQHAENRHHPAQLAHHHRRIHQVASRK